MGSAPSSKVITIAAAASTLLVAAVYVLRLDRAAGLVIDDAYYVLLAQSLAHGGPFAIVSSATTPILPSVPPLFPAVLALVFRLSPLFPSNVAALKCVSIAAILGTGMCTFWFASRVRQLPLLVAWAIAMVVALTPAFVFLATSTVMAECVFTLLQVAAVVAIERAASSGQPDQARRASIAGALAAATWLTRSAGITLIAAGVLRLFLAGRRESMALFAAVVMAFGLPWTIYAAQHAPGHDDRDRYGGSIVVAYSEAILLRVAGAPASGRVSPGELPLRIARNALNIFGRDVAGEVAPVVFRSANESGEEVFSLGALGLLAGSMGNAAGTIVLSLALSVVAIVGFVAASKERITAVEFLVPLTLMMLVIYPYWTFRFVLPLAPFVLVYLVLGFRTIGRLATADEWRLPRIFLLTVGVLHLADHVQYVRLLRNPATRNSINWLADQDGVDAALVRLQPDAARQGGVASTNPALVYLRTGRKGVTFDGSAVKLTEWKALGIRYVAAMQPTEMPAALRNASVVYRAPGGRLWIVDIS